jgi:hypothetical protein
MKHDVFDIAASTGTLASSKRLERNQIANILELFESEADPLASVKLTIAFITRQVGRREIPIDIGNKMVSDLKIILNSLEGEELKAATRKYLYLLKWFFESGVRFRSKDFNDFLERLIR